MSRGFKNIPKERGQFVISVTTGRSLHCKVQPPPPFSKKFPMSIFRNCKVSILSLRTFLLNNALSQEQVTPAKSDAKFFAQTQPPRSSGKNFSLQERAQPSSRRDLEHEIRFALKCVIASMDMN